MSSNYSAYFLTSRLLHREIGWDEKDCWFAHCCMLDADERAFFAERGIGIAHCPSSNMRLASGIAPVRTAVKRQ